MTLLALATLLAIYSIFQQAYGWRRAILGTGLTVGGIVLWAGVMAGLG